MSTDAADAAVLREAACILRARARKRTFWLRVITRCLDTAAGKLDHATEWNAVTGRRG